MSPEQLSFALLFLRCRGSLKDVGAALDISYPTAQNRLDELLKALNLDETDEIMTVDAEDDLVIISLE